MPKNLISYWLPEWMVSVTKNKKCNKCDAQLFKNDVIAVGIRQNELSVALYIEHKCHECQYRAITVLNNQKENTLEKMCYALLESIKQRKIAEKSAELRKKKEGKMTDGEVKNMINFIKQAATHEDFLRQIGVPPPKKQNDQD